MFRKFLNVFKKKTSKEKSFEMAMLALAYHLRAIKENPSGENDFFIKVEGTNTFLYLGEKRD